MIHFQFQQKFSQPETDHLFSSVDREFNNFSRTLDPSFEIFVEKALEDIRNTLSKPHARVKPN
jgi:hypothetical protein